MFRTTLTATAALTLIASAQADGPQNCVANPSQPFCGGEYDDTELRERIEVVEGDVTNLDQRVTALENFEFPTYDDTNVVNNINNLDQRLTVIENMEFGSNYDDTELRNLIDELASDANAGLAGVAAMSSIPEALAGRTAVGIGYGNWGGESAIALGFSTRSEDGDHAFTLSGTQAGDETGVSAGYSFSF